MSIKSITVKNGKLVTIKEEDAAELVVGSIGGLVAIAIAAKRIPTSKYPRWQIAGVTFMVASYIYRHVVIVKKFVDAKETE